MYNDPFAGVFPLGSHLCREPMPPMSEMKRDMELLRKKGFNLIKLQENWMVDEPIEGQIDLSRYEELIDGASKLDLSIYLGLTCEQAPNWLFNKYPDARMVRKDGLPVAFQAQSTLHADGKPGPCYDHPGAMDAQLTFIRHLVKTLGRFENVAVWNTWQEIGYWSEGLAGDAVCYCEHSIAGYRSWLSTVYENDIDRLNRHWNARYASFDDVEPDRCKRLVCIPQQYFYHYYMDNVQIANVLTERCRAIKEADPFGRPVFAHKGGPSLSSGADWTYARTQDFLGTSNYPAWGFGSAWDDLRQMRRIERHGALVTELWDNLAYKMDYIRSANRPGAPIWAAEYQGGRVSTDLHPGRVPSAEDMNRWMLTTLGAGTTALSFWITRAEIMAPETNGFSLLDSEGESTERLEAAAALGETLNRHAPLFNQNNRPQAQVALLVDEWNHQLLRTMAFAPSVLEYDLRGWYKHLWSNGIPCDFIEAGQLTDARAMAYKAIIAPFSHSMSDAVAKSLVAYAKQGGRVLLECAPGMLDEAGYAPRGMMNPILRDALGIKVASHSLVREPGDADRYSQPERTWGEYEEAGMLIGAGDYKGLSLRASVLIDTFEAPEEQVYMTWNGRPCAISARAGEGAIDLIGTCVGFSATAYADENTAAAIQAILKKLGLTPEHAGKLLITRRIGDAEEAWFITNPLEETVTEALDINGEAFLVDGKNERRLGEKRVELTLNPLDVRLLIVKKG